MSNSKSWHIVLEQWHPFPHYGLDGLPWPLGDRGETAERIEAAMQPLPIAPGGCIFQGCFDMRLARTYFELAALQIELVYWIEVTTLDEPMTNRHGFDVGRPNGGFSIIGQEICKNEEGHRRFGHMLNEYGLFPDDTTMRRYLDERAKRVDIEGLEYLDESIPMQINILDRGGLSNMR